MGIYLKEKNIRNSLMLDLETIGTVPGSVITSIGAAFFDPHENYEVDFPDDLELFYRNININSCFNAGLKADGETILWWMQQGQEAVDALTTPKPIALKTAVTEFKRFYWDQKEKLGRETNIYVWAHGATFDQPMWATACNAVGQREPWLFFNCRDTRTIFDLAFGEEKPSFEGLGTKHNAVHDALSQIVWVQEAYAKLGISPEC